MEHRLFKAAGMDSNSNVIRCSCGWAHASTSKDLLKHADKHLKWAEKNPNQSWTAVKRSDYDPYAEDGRFK
jgi:acetone carboxylase gamma subunit